MNESKSSRYHRTRRRASAAQALAVAALLGGLAVSSASVQLREWAGGSEFVYTLALMMLCACVATPFAWYRSHRLERLYDLSKATFAVWLRDYLKTAILTAGLMVIAVQMIYTAMRLSPEWWWLVCAIAGTALAASITALAPVWILPLFHRIRPLARESLCRRLQGLSASANVPVLSVHEWTLGDTTTRAHAALVGAGGTRRILVSDTLLADYTDDEIAVVLAHEIGHHVHRDLWKAVAAEFLTLLACFWIAAAAVRAWGIFAGRATSDVAGLPVILLALGGTWLLASPLLNALSRVNERSADRFALQLTQHPDAFIAVVRRMAAQNLAEEHPSRAAFLMCHTHPTIEERIAAAREMGAAT